MKHKSLFIKTVLLLLVLGYSAPIKSQEKDKLLSYPLHHSNCIGDSIYTYDWDNAASYVPDMQSLSLFITNNRRRQTNNNGTRIHGKVFATFIIEKDGSLSDPFILKGLSEACDKEALRLIESIPKAWNPATKDGKAVRSQVNLPISFW